MHNSIENQLKQELLFHVDQNIGADTKTNIETMIRSLAISRSWSVAPPIFIEETDEYGCETLGGILEIYSALPPNVLPHEIDAQNLKEVEAVISEVQIISRREGLSFEFYLGTNSVGSIEDGVIDKILQEGLLLPWRKTINTPD